MTMGGRWTRKSVGRGWELGKPCKIPRAPLLLRQRDNLSGYTHLANKAGVERVLVAVERAAEAVLEFLGDGVSSESEEVPGSEGEEGGPRMFISLCSFLKSAFLFPLFGGMGVGDRAAPV